ncbi:MAG: hypothetical protein SWH61_08250 [Thermodesulfobacteriota bacterium]|nr:hypothetical protein [Thermodesulfobacteriota bacterium]
MNVSKKQFGIILGLLLLIFNIPAARAAYTLADAHPRVLITADELAVIAARMNGPEARDPYRTWFQRIRDRETAAQSDDGMAPDLMSLALLYNGTTEPAEKADIRQWYLDAIDQYLDGRVQTLHDDADSRCGPSYEAFIAMDLMWEEIPDATKLKAFEAASGINAFYWHSGVNAEEQDFGYHGAAGRAPAFAFAALFDGEPIMSHPDVVSDPDTYSFDTAIYIAAIQEELSGTGYFWRIENRIAGDPTYNSALPGDFGGMYDNIGYDTGEESWSIFLVAAVTSALSEDRLTGFLHDRYRGRFYQHLEIPHTATTYGTGENEFEERRIEVIWNTQTDWNTSPRENALAITATKYQDPHMQYYADRWRKRLNVYDYDYYITELDWMLCYYDDDLEISPPSANPTAMYFSGPGLVTMREDATPDAAFSVFVAGEGISRRYEDANSFLLSRKGPIVVHAGARIRYNEDNSRHAWYHIRSISKNIMKVFDPLERFDVDDEGRVLPLHDGTYELVPSDNMGGQLFETGIAESDGDYPTGYSDALTYRRDTAFDLGVWNTADIIKYEHVADDYTYTVGDGAPAYTGKIDFFEREYVYLRPDVFVMFDRVQAADPSFKKAWTIHTVDTPDTTTASDDIGQGGRAYTNARQFTMANEENITVLHTLLPEENRTVVRGGDTVLTQGHPLRNGTPIGGDAVMAGDTPRWLELFAVGTDTEGTVTLYGDAREGNGVSEDIVFDGTLQYYKNTIRTGDDVQFTDNRMIHDNAVWEPGQWAGYMLLLRGSGDMHIIVANTTDTLTLASSVDGSGVWAYSIVRPLANTYYHWQRIDQVTTTDMDVDNLTISVPHYFDTRGADGTVYGFSPHTDGQDDGYSKRTDLGQYTLEVETVVPETLTNFLNVFTLGDPGTQLPDATAFQNDSVAGAVIGDRMVVFARDRTMLSELTFDSPEAGQFDLLVMDLVPDTVYTLTSDGSTVTVSSTGSGAPVTTTPMGVLQGTVEITDVPQQEGNPAAGNTPFFAPSGSGGGCFIQSMQTGFSCWAANFPPCRE